jgi:uncharacterized protein (DUF302 family)
MTEYGYTVEVPEGYDEAVIRTRLALRSHGFSVLSEMHVGGLLGPEAGTERQYLIMGVFAGALEQRRLGSDIQMAVHLPCNFVIQESGSSAVVAALDPDDMTDPTTGVTGDITEEARAALSRVLQTVETGINDG